MIISLEFASEILTHDFVGYYRVQVQFITIMDTLACYVFGSEVQEVEC